MDFSSFSWRTLVVILIVQKWYLKIIAPIIATSLITGYAIYYTPESAIFYLAKTASQLISVVLIISCEDKMKWKLIKANVEQEKWMPVNNFILNNIPENIIILDLSGEIKFTSDYCKASMKKCHLSLETKDFTNKIRDLNQQQYEPEPPSPSGVNFILEFSF